MGGQKHFFVNFFGDCPPRINAEGKMEPKLAIFVQGTQTPGVVQLDLNLPGLGIHFYTKNAIIAIELFHLHWVVMFFNYLP